MWLSVIVRSCTLLVHQVVDAIVYVHWIGVWVEACVECRVWQQVGLSVAAAAAAVTVAVARASSSVVYFILCICDMKLLIS